MTRFVVDCGAVTEVADEEWCLRPVTAREWLRALGAAERDAFVVCFALAVPLFGSGAGREPAEIAAYYASHGDRIRQIAGFYVLAIGVLFFLWFAAVLRDELEAPLVLVTGTLTGTLLLGADAVWAATAITAQHEHPFLLDPNTHLIVEDTGFALFVAAMLGAMAFVTGASVAVLRTRALPRIFGVIGFPIAASLAAAWYYLPVFALLTWIGAASILLLARDRRFRTAV